MPRIRSRTRAGVTATAVPAARLTVPAATGTARAADPEKRTVDGPGTVRPAKEDSATFWAHSRTDGESAVSVDRLGGGRASLSVNGEKVTAVGGAKKGTERVRMFLSGGINKITATGASGRPALDRLRVAPAGGTLQTEVYQAEDGTLTGTGKVTDAYTVASAATRSRTSAAERPTASASTSPRGTPAGTR